MQNPKIIFFDIDETLYRKATDTLRPSILEVMSALKAKGILTAIATGRPEVALPAKVRAVIEEAGIDLLITINGQFIRYRGEVIDKHPLNKTSMGEMARFFESENIAYAFVANDNIATSDETPDVVAAMSGILPEHLVDKNYYREHDVYQMLAFYDAAKDAAVNAKVAEYGYKTVRWHEAAVDMLDAQGSKARGIRTAIEKLGIDMKDVMAFGDGLNDIEMMKTVGFGVAMGNGHPDLKALADYVCPSVDEDGVLKGLKALGVID